MTGKPAPAQERFWRYAYPEPNSGCWLWDGAVDPNGYGRFSVESKARLAHKFYYEFLNGPVPEGLELDHKCRNPSCVNPDHLEAVSHKTNCLRGVGVIALRAWNKNKTHCRNGHPFDEANTYAYGNERRCRVCTREAGRRHDAKRRS